ncbi:OLC1v1008792C1 [Oldenlandia corymbosa var. corymbosa]|uniref:OLC1v1008792C1 n=1 Tax=Oldenlandia corymbosa var. corymbosa TaxID=529605 RepID=A0AAV1DMC4_OLDCO|nr:OLC1v1008792C1 [Oldenlandia corymbosa var. corymbosa]
MMEKSSWVVEVGGDDNNKLSEIIEAEKKDWDKHSIYKLPHCVTDLNEKAYKPRAISFGPYHHGEPNLAAMEAHKSRALIRFLNRSRKCMDYYIHVLEGAVVEDLMDAYDGLDPKWREDPKGFLRMMIRDGCFMLELLRASSALSSSFGNDIGGQGGGYADNDPIFSNHGKLHMMPYIKRDMLMLENQLPMLLLTTLLSEEEEMIDEKVDEKVNKLIVEFCSLDKQCYLELGKCKHVLDVYRKVLLGDDNHPKLAKLLASSWLPERPTTGDASRRQRISTKPGFPSKRAAPRASGTFPSTRASSTASSGFLR